MHTNALIHEKSPYLRQHAHNPVDWLSWGDAAFEKARREDKPIFLSIGYSTCHWCHVMAHESFENERVAEILNREFVPVKVDREERPDVDRIYMLFVQASTGSGGWPMSVWLTPDLKPFFGGTYFPVDSRYGRPGFGELLQHVANAWKQDRQRVENSSASVVEQLRAISASATATTQLNRELFDAAYWQFRRTFDARWGGFGSAPKFPRPVVFNYLLRYYATQKNAEALDMAVETLRHMAAGGMHDHLGGGFHRYSVDERWFVPHFEKMLYDQAQLAISYLEAYQITRDADLPAVARKIFSYVLRDLADAGGGFYSAEDADSPDPEDPAHSGEGAFYIWRKREIERLLDKQSAAAFCKRFGVREEGNVAQDPQGEFTGRNILYEAATLEEAARASGMRDDEISAVFARAKEVLFQARSKRPRPHLDNKILTSWNALMISALVKGYVVLGEREYLDAAKRAASFLLQTMYDGDSVQLRRRFCDGEAAVPGFIDDYAFFTQALLDLFEATFDAAYLQTALDIARQAFPQFEDKQQGGFFSTVENAADLLIRMKDDYDGAEPSGNSIATDVLVRLMHLTGDNRFRRSGERSLEAFALKIKAQPTIAPQMLVALDRWLAEPEQIVIRCASVTPDVQKMFAKESERFAPHSVLLIITDDSVERLKSMAPFLSTLERKGTITIYECRNFTCELPKIIE